MALLTLLWEQGFVYRNVGLDLNDVDFKIMELKSAEKVDTKRLFILEMKYKMLYWII